MNLGIYIKDHEIGIAVSCGFVTSIKYKMIEEVIGQLVDICNFYRIRKTLLVSDDKTLSTTITRHLNRNGFWVLETSLKGIKEQLTGKEEDDFILAVPFYLS